MAIFDYPRINVKGLIQVNVGTANNDDYSGYQFPSGNFYPGQPVRLADSKNVQPITYGMNDDQWVAWAQSSVPVYDPPPPSAATQAAPKFFARYEAEPANNNVIPGEWNYYGDMGLTMMNVKVSGINDPYHKFNALMNSYLLESTLSYNNRVGSNGRSTAMLIDINPEDPTNSQVFTDNLAMMTGTQIIFNGKPSKAMTRWINFARNANLTGPNGAAATFQCVIPLAELQGQMILQGLPTTNPSTGKALAGIVCRYTLYRPLQVYNYFKYTPSQWIAEMIQLYKTKGTNADFLELQGTIAPWFDGDAISQTTGRLLNPVAFPTPADFKGNAGPTMRLAPAIARFDEKTKTLSVDCSATFPDNYKGTDKYDPMITGNNPKYDIGPMTIGVLPKDGSPSVQIGILDYRNMLKNDANGWIFDFTVDQTLVKIIQEGTLYVNCAGSTVKQNVLLETPLLIFSEQSGVYGEQVNTPGAKSTNFRYDAATNTSVSFIAYRNGVPVPSGDGQKFTLYYYDTTPNQQPGPRILLQDNYVLGNPLGMPVSSAGNILVTCVPVDAPPPIQYGNFDPLTGSILNLRVLPNNIDYSQYYKDPNAPIPEGNDKLTFEVIYDLVLRNYYLLYPAMSKVVKLNDPLMWEDATMARELMNRLSLPAWPTAIAMPRTRDLSDSRRKLLTAWCLKIINRKPNPSSPKYTHP